MENQSTVEMTEGNTNPTTETDELENLNLSGGDFEPNPEDVRAGEVAEDQPDLPTKDIVLMAVSPLIDILAPAWGVTDQEKEMLAGAYAPVIDKYFPDVGMSVEFSAIAVTAIIFAPRLSMPRKIEQPEEGDNGAES